MSACEAQCVIDDLTEQIAKISNTLATLKNSCDQTPTPVLQPTPTPKEETPTPKEETPTPIAQIKKHQHQKKKLQLRLLKIKKHQHQKKKLRHQQKHRVL